MRRKIIGTLSIMLATVLIIDSMPGITGNVISGETGFSLVSLFGLVFLVCGLALFFLDAKEEMKKKAR